MLQITIVAHIGCCAYHGLLTSHATAKVKQASTSALLSSIKTLVVVLAYYQDLQQKSPYAKALDQARKSRILKYDTSDKTNHFEVELMSRVVFGGTTVGCLVQDGVAFGDKFSRRHGYSASY